MDTERNRDEVGEIGLHGAEGNKRCMDDPIAWSNNDPSSSDLKDCGKVG